MKNKYFWPRMNKNIMELSRSCLDCQQSKINRHVKTIPDHFTPPDARFPQVHIDLIGPLPASKEFKYCLTCIDRFSRWPEAVPIKDITAETVAKALYEIWISRFGSPEVICTDQGTQFESELFKSLMQILGCKRNRTTGHHPAANGLVERWHRSLKTAMMCHQTDEAGNEIFQRWRRTIRDTIQDLSKTDWVDILPTVLLGLRTSIRQSLDASPAEFLYGTPLRIPGEFFEPGKQMTFNAAEAKNFIEPFRQQMDLLRPVPVKHKQKKKPFIYKELADCNHVFLREENTTSLERPYSSPFEVISRQSDRVFVILRNGKEISVSIERLKPAHLLVEDANSTRSPELDQQNVQLDHSYGDAYIPSGRVAQHDHSYVKPPSNPPICTVTSSYLKKVPKNKKKTVTFLMKPQMYYFD